MESRIHLNNHLNGTLLWWSHNVTLRMLILWLFAFLKSLCILLSWFTLFLWYKHRVIFHLKVEVHLLIYLFFFGTLDAIMAYSSLISCHSQLLKKVTLPQLLEDWQLLFIPFSKKIMMSYLKTYILTDCPEVVALQSFPSPINGSKYISIII